MKITTLVFDFSWVLMFPKDPEYHGKVNELHFKLNKSPDYQFFDHFRLNQELFDYLKKLKNGFSINMFTAGVVQDLPTVREKLDPVFEKIYSKRGIEIEKTDPKAYKFIAKDLGKEVGEILFIDDTEKNVEAAKEAGLKTMVFESNKKLFIELDKLIKF